MTEEQPNRMERDIHTIKVLLVVAAVVIVGLLINSELEKNDRAADHVIHCTNYPAASDCP